MTETRYYKVKALKNKANWSTSVLRTIVNRKLRIENYVIYCRYIRAWYVMASQPKSVFMKNAA